MPSAVRSLETKMKPAAAFAVCEFMTSLLCDDPRKLGKPLAEPFRGYLNARRGVFRVIYRIDDQNHAIRVIAVEHRADVYRPR